MKKTKAFTLIETLIVIVVFCIGILTVLYWLSQTLRNKEYANTQIQSAFFAREWIELMFNLRDANYHKELPWNCIFEWKDSLDPEYGCIKFFEPNQVLKLDIGDNDKYIKIIDVSDTSKIWDLKKDEDFEKTFEAYQIYKHTQDNGTTFVYNHDSNNGEETWFARYIVIKGVDSDEWEINDKLLKIESHVLYKKWIFKWEKVMETFIGNYEFNDNILF
jgi:prepilin-type N-terminal cleavage/methylation domain-containing protein